MNVTAFGGLKRKNGKNENYLNPVSFGFGFAANAINERNAYPRVKRKKTKI